MLDPTAYRGFQWEDAAVSRGVLFPRAFAVSHEKLHGSSTDSHGDPRYTVGSRGESCGNQVKVTILSIVEKRLRRHDSCLENTRGQARFITTPVLSSRAPRNDSPVCRTCTPRHDCTKSACIFQAPMAIPLYSQIEHCTTTMYHVPGSYCDRLIPRYSQIERARPLYKAPGAAAIVPAPVEPHYTHCRGVPSILMRGRSRMTIDPRYSCVAVVV